MPIQPEGEASYFAIIENDDKAFSSTSRRQLSSISTLDESRSVSSSSSQVKPPKAMHGCRLAAISFPIGRGWALNVGKDDIPCTGTYGAESGRQAGNPCLLNGHNDGKGGIVFDSLSGWLLMRLKETWQHKNHQGGWTSVESSELTDGCTEENNGMDETTHTRPQSTTGVNEHRRLSVASTVARKLCPTFQFQYAINGQIQSMSPDEFLQKRIFVQAVVETWTLLDDPTFSSGQEADMELGCKVASDGMSKS